MSSPRRGDRGFLQKIDVTCKTCGVTESFYSDLSVERFKAEHAGHEVVGGKEERVPKVEETQPVPTEEGSLEKDWGTKLAKVVVDVVVFPALRDSVFRVRGFKDDLEEAFVATSRFENGEKVKRMLESGEYIDYQEGGTRYVWEDAAIEYEGDAREMLGMPGGSAPQAAPEEPEREPSELDESTVAKTNEMLFGEPGKAEGERGGVDSVFAAAPEPQAEAESYVAPEPVRPPSRAQELPPEPKPREKLEAKAPEAPSGPAEEQEPLLVSKTWYIQGGEKNRKEAARVSKVLKDFRWKVEPLYTIGVILDDILSIETSKNQISRALIARVESAGYRLTAVTIDQGKPVAWFKKAGSAPSPSDPTGLDGDQAEFEADVAG